MGTFTNPVVFSDVPDEDIIRVGNAYYMISTTIHMSPGAPIMRSYDLVNWEIVNYVYDYLEEDDARSLKNGKSD
ncbi:MAG: glycosyl hydrolase 43 family protein [Eubacterium sp.]|nr:glycosyl hydrolase 43 family protein [Eubacterium sp.]